MKCLHCNQKLSIYARLMGRDFCNDAHKNAYHRDYNHLVVEALQRCEQLSGGLMSSRMSLAGLRQDQRGASFIETAILIPVILLMAVGTMDFARVIYAGIEVSNAARAGVQFGALTPGNSGNTDGMVQAALNDASDLGLNRVTASARNFCSCNSGTGEVSCSDTSCGTTPSGYVSVTANYTFNTLFAWPGLPSSVVLARTAKMRVQ